MKESRLYLPSCFYMCSLRSFSSFQKIIIIGPTTASIFFLHQFSFFSQIIDMYLIVHVKVRKNLVSMLGIRTGPQESKDGRRRRIH